MVTISEEAVTHLKDLMAEAPDAKALRVYITQGGCSGFSYGMGLDSGEIQENDEVSETQGILVYVDSFSAEHLDGAEIDYIDALMGGGFTVNNPNAASTCGCGHSFQTKDKEGQPRSCGA